MEIITPGVGLIFWTTLIFILLVIVLGKLAWTPIVSALKEREESISTALAQAEKARLEMQKLQSDNEALLQQARIERDKLIKEARTTANKMIEEAQEKGASEYNKMLEAARKEIQVEKEAALAEVKNKIADISISVAEKLVRKQFSDTNAQKSLVADYLKEIKIN